MPAPPVGGAVRPWQASRTYVTVKPLIHKDFWPRPLHEKRPAHGQPSQGRGV